MFNLPSCFGGHFFTFVALTMLLFFVALGQGAYAGMPTIVALYTMDGCGPCEMVKKTLVKKGTDITVDYVTTQPLVDAFPTCVYSDGKRDHGTRVLFRMIEFPENLTIIHYKE